MHESSLVALWSQVSRSFLSRTPTRREIETAQNAFLAGALGVFLTLEHAIDSGGEAQLATAVKRLRRELNLGLSKRPRARVARTSAAARRARIARTR
jgi:hypothetical protein